MESVYDYIGDGIRIRSKCEWYGLGERLTMLFQPQKKKKKKKKNQTLNLGDCCWREWTNDQQVISNIIKKIMKHSKEKKKKKTPQKMML